MDVVNPGMETFDAPHQFAYNPNPKTLTWQRLEELRLKSLGLSNRYSRHFNVTRASKENGGQRHSMPDCGSSWEAVAMPQKEVKDFRPGTRKRGSKVNNSLAPFSTFGKPTCGFFFSRVTDNKKKNFGIPPSDLVKWRC